MRIAGEIEAGIGLPSFALESFASLLCRNGRISTSVGIGKHRIGVLVGGNGCAGRGRRSRGGRRVLSAIGGRRSTPARGHPGGENDGSNQLSTWHAHGDLPLEKGRHSTEFYFLMDC